MTSRPSPQASDDIQRYEEGWRRGKPREDPEKLKRWGWVSARPSEFLLCMRGGQVVASGQGATVFKWPWESVAIVPTTVQRLTYSADQITSEKTGVKVTGIVMYRIAEPLIASRMLNFSFPERAQEKLATMMEEMCVGATRRLVANLTLEECLTRRKDALASELVREIAPVVSGQGRLEDRTNRGWGLVVDTIEIQDVRVLSQTVFANMQAGFREEAQRSARAAELGRELAVRTAEAGTAQAVELSRVAAQTEIRRQRQAADEAAKLEKVASDARVEEQQLASQRALRQNQLATEREHQLARLEAAQEMSRLQQQAKEAAELEALQARGRLKEETLRAELQEATLAAEAEQRRHLARLAEERQRSELNRAIAQTAEARLAVADLEARIAELNAQASQLDGQADLDRAARLKAIENSISAEAIQLAVATRLPELAQAFQQKMGEVHVTAVDGANPFGYIAAAVEGVLGLARSAGLGPIRPQG